MFLGPRLGFGLNRLKKFNPSISALIPSAIVDIDATIGSSYPGAGQPWLNLVPAPADGTSKVQNNFRLGISGSSEASDPTFTGTAGNYAAYFAMDGSDACSFSGSNTPFFRDLHKTTGASSFWIAVAFRAVIDGVNTQILFATNPAAGSPGIRLIVGTTGALTLRQRDDLSGNNNATSVATLTNGQDYLVIVSKDSGSNAVRFWINSTTSESRSLTYGTSTTDAGIPGVGGESDAGLPLLNGSRFYAFGAGNTFIDDTAALAIFNFYADRHHRGYSIPVLRSAPSLNSPNTAQAFTLSDGQWTQWPTSFTKDLKLDAVSVGYPYTRTLGDGGKTAIGYVTATNAVGNSTQQASNTVVLPADTISATFRVAETDGRIPNGIINSAGKEKFAFVRHHVVAADTYKFKLTWDAYYQTAPAGSEASPGNGGTINSAKFTFGATTIALLFSGVGTKTYAANDIFSCDEVDVLTAFGVHYIPAGTIVYSGFDVTVPVAGNSVPYMGNGARTVDYTGQQAISYTGGSVGNTTGSGVYTTSGLTVTTQVSGWRPTLEGRYESSHKSFIVDGDSLTEYQNDTTGVSVAGRGFYARAAYNGGTGVIYPLMNLGRGAAYSDLAVNATKRRHWYGKADIVVTGFFTNDIQAGKSLAYMKGKFDAINTVLAGYSNLTKVYWLPPFLRATSTDSFATTTNQTPVSGWETGGTIDQIIAYENAAVGGTIDGVWSNVKDALITTSGGQPAWKADGVTANLYTQDGVHYQPYAAILAAVPTRAYMDGA